MCVAASDPKSDTVGDRIPTKHATPLVDQPGLLNSVNTLLACVLGARIHMGVIIAKKPRTWRINTVPSTNGSFRARNVLKMPQIAVTAIASKVTCQVWGMKLLLFKIISASISIAARNELAAEPVCHPRTESHPTM